MKVFLYKTEKRAPGTIVSQLLRRYALDFFICIGCIGFVVFNDSLKINPMLKIQNKNKSFVAIFKQGVKKNRIEENSGFSIRHEEYKTRESNFIGCYYNASGVLYLNKSYRGELTRDQAREIYECYLSYL